MLQRKDEIYLSVNATKVKRNIYMRARLNPLLFFNGQSAAKARTEQGSTTSKSYVNRYRDISY